MYEIWFYFCILNSYFDLWSISHYLTNFVLELQVFFVVLRAKEWVVCKEYIWDKQH